MTRARDVAGFISNVNAAGKNFLINGGFAGNTNFWCDTFASELMYKFNG